MTESKEVKVNRKYFLTETERKATGSTVFYEFSVGSWDRDAGKFWNEDSMCIDLDDFAATGLEELIASIVPAYAPYDSTEISKSQWQEIYALAEKTGGEVFNAVSELSPWADTNFRCHEVFTILGL